MRTHILSNKSKGISSGLAPRREGPFEVTDMVSSHVFNLRDMNSGQVVNKVHINDLSPVY